MNPPFFFRRKIGLLADERDYVRQCQSATRRALRAAQQADSGPSPHWDLRNGLTLYLVVLGEILAGRTIRYTAPLHPSVCMAAYLGHERMFSIFGRNGVDVCRMEWSTLNVLFAAILGHRLGFVKRLLAAHPSLKSSRHLWFGNPGAFCAAFGNVRILRFLRNVGFNLAEVHRFPNQPPNDPRHFGSALLFAMRQNQRAIVKDLAAHGEFCPWQNLGGEYGEGTASVFEVAVKHRFFDIAQHYLDHGWLEPPATEDDFRGMLRYVAKYDGVEAFRFLEKAFPQFDATSATRREGFGPRIRRHCGIENPPKPDPDGIPPPTASIECQYLRDWISCKRHDMVRYELDLAPEILPLVWPELAEPIRAAFRPPSDDDSPCRPYLFRLAKSLGISLFPDETARRLWEEKCNILPSWKCQLAMEDVFLFDEGVEGGYYHPEELREKYFRALQARGAAARRLMDDPDIDPNTDLSWNAPFSSWIGDVADWKTFKGWLLRGMEIYRENDDDPGIFALAQTPSVVRHLLPDLEHRPWLSKAFSGNTLVQAAAFGDLRAVTALLDAGCPVNFSRMVPGDKISPLRAALLNGRDAVARLLYTRGGMNLWNGVVYPVPPWIAKPRPLDLPAIRRACGDPTASPILIDPIMPLPAKLARLRDHWLENAKALNGNTLCLHPSGCNVVVFRCARRLYALRRESLSMDQDAFEVSLDEICRDLSTIHANPVLV